MLQLRCLGIFVECGSMRYVNCFTDAFDVNLLHDGVIRSLWELTNMAKWVGNSLYCVEPERIVNTAGIDG